MTCTQPVLAASRYTGASPTVSGTGAQALRTVCLGSRTSLWSVSAHAECSLNQPCGQTFFLCITNRRWVLCGPATQPPKKTNRAENVLVRRSCTIYNQDLSVQRCVCCLVGNSNFAQKYRTLTYTRDIIAARRISAMHQLCQPVCACTYSSRVCTYIHRV